MSIANLRAAARLAREASQGRRTIYLTLAEEGVTVRGCVMVHGQRHTVNRCVVWPDLSSPADLASDAVVTVDRELSAMEGRA